MNKPPEYTRMLYDLLYGEVSNALIPAKPKRGELQRMIAKSHHASIRAERRRKRKAFQARKVGNSRGKYNPKQISEKTAVAFLAAALLGGLRK